MATRFKVLGEDNEPEITVTWWLTRSAGRISLWACAQEGPHLGSGDQEVLRIGQDGSATALQIYCPILRKVIGKSDDGACRLVPKPS